MSISPPGNWKFSRFFGLLSFLVGLFIVNSAIGLTFEQRLPMLRTLRACGVSSRTLNAGLLIELVSLALGSGFIGLLSGYVIAASLLPDVVASLRGLYGAQITGHLMLKAEWWIAGLAMSIAGALVAAASSFLKLHRLSVLAAAQPYAWQQRITSGLSLTDTHNGLRAMTQRGARAIRLRQNRMAHASEFLNQVFAKQAQIHRGARDDRIQRVFARKGPEAW